MGTSVPVTKYFRADLRTECENVSETLEDLLLLLSPYVLLKPAQWVLQFLVTTHKVSHHLRPVFRIRICLVSRDP